MNPNLSMILRKMKIFHPNLGMLSKQSPFCRLMCYIIWLPCRRQWAKEQLRRLSKNEESQLVRQSLNKSTFDKKLQKFVNVSIIPPFSFRKIAENWWTFSALSVFILFNRSKYWGNPSINPRNRWNYTTLSTIKSSKMTNIMKNPLPNVVWMNSPRSCGIHHLFVSLTP